MQKANVFPEGYSRIIIASTLGGMLEAYDFIVFALFASVLGRLFFPEGDSFIQLISAFATFAVGYLARPVGGIILAHLGDRYGRKKPFTLAIVMMGVATLLIGCLPDYNSIGVLAPLLLVVLRIIQGLSLGGEIPCAITYISEVSYSRRYTSCSWLYAGVFSGIVLGSLIYSAIYGWLGDKDVYSWGWRIPFWLGGLLGIIGFYIRKHFYESPAYNQAKASASKVPIIAVLTDSRSVLLGGIMLVGAGTTALTLMFVFAPAYLTGVLTYHPAEVGRAVSAGLSVAALLLIGVGLLTRKIQVSYIIRAVLGASIVLPLAIFYLYSQGAELWLPLLLSAVICGGFYAIIPGILVDMFPAEHRYSGIAFIYNIGHYFTAAMPAMALTLVHWGGDTWIPGLLVSVCAMLTFFFIKKLLYAQDDALLVEAATVTRE